jgi:hypothetical protein
VEYQTSNLKTQNKSQIQRTKDDHVMNNAKVYDIRERLLIFGRKILTLCRKLPRTPEAGKIRG